MMVKLTWLLLISIVFFNCNADKKDEEDKSKLEILFDQYYELNLPFSVSDSNIAKMDKTALQKPNIFTETVPDSIFSIPFGKDRKFTIIPLGKITQKSKENYLATLVKTKNQSAIYLSVFDKGIFKTNLPLIVDNEEGIVHSTSLDKKLSVVVNKEWAVKNELYYNRIIYVYNNVGVFTTVLTETNEERATSHGIINPIDTFPKLFNYSGNYVFNKKSFLFLRDGATVNEYLFYVYFMNDENGETCKGELRGRLKMLSDKTGTYSTNGDPCNLNFTFSTKQQVSVKETGSCGNYRGIKCFFNHTFIKEKQATTKTKKK